jgi:RimJ/RimL family protein N-acetyltransferase
VPLLIEPVVPAGRMSGIPQPVLRGPVGGAPAGDDLVLRPWREADAPVLALAYQDPAIQRWHARSMDEAEARDWIRHRAERWSAEAGADWAVTVGDSIVGRAGLRTVDLTEGLAEVAYWTLPTARGHGVAGRALRRVTRWCTDELRLHRLELVHATENTASCRVAEKSGYRYEGTLRQAVPHADGFHDMHLHAHLATDPD